MKIYFYHTQDLQRIYQEWKEGTFAGHFLYGATYLNDFGIEMIMHKHNPSPLHWKITLCTTWRILSCRKRYDVLYATSFRGLEIIIFLHALGLYRHPIVLWHHQPIVTAKNVIRERLARIFYHGIDKMIFFSQKIVKDSLLSKKSRPDKMYIVPWGADLDFYDRVMKDNPIARRSGFISTGKELRDMPTLIKAFNETGKKLDLYIREAAGNINYRNVLGRIKCEENVKIHFIEGLIPNKISIEVNKAACIVICCLESNYTVGLTTVVEALALGIPLICSRNPQIPIDINREGCGISVEYGDVEGWIKAINFISDNPEKAAEMGKRGRQVAEREFNIKNCARQVADILLSTHK
jgi:glycosyltransferase involved in cell wall biosynthesis